MEEDRDFYNDDCCKQDKCLGWCIYCKNEVFEGEEVFHLQDLYHKECFIILNTGLEPGIND